MKITRVGVDSAKHVFQLHGVDRSVWVTGRASLASRFSGRGESRKG